ncbi:MAG: Fic family protein [Betaproteobacteria bacterium]
MIFATPKLPAQYRRVIEDINRSREKLRFATSDSIHRWWGILARTAAARAMVGSNTIEGINASMDDAMAVIDGEPELSEDDENRAALIGFWNAMTYIVQLSKDSTYTHNEGTIKSLHYMLMSYDLTKHPGRWRTSPIHVSNTATNKVVYEGPDAQFVPTLMQELILFLNSECEEPLVKAAMTHLNLTMVHPFLDGNGRMARALQTMVLSREGILDPHFSSIEEYIGSHSADYYAVLTEVGQGSWNPQRDALPWIKFCLTAHARQAHKLLRRLEETRAIWTQLEALARQHRLNERVVNALAEATMGYKVRNPSYRKLADVSNQVAKVDLKNLADLGLLIPVGEKRGRYYERSELLTQLRKSVRSSRGQEEIDPFEDPESLPHQAFLPGFSSRKTGK